MRILQLCNKAPYPANDGSSIAIYNMTLGLLSNKADVHLLTINTKKHFKETGEIPLDFIKKTHYLAVYKNTDTHFLGLLLNLFSSSSYFESRFFFKEFKVELIKKLSEYDFDIIQLEGLFMSPYIETIRKYSKAKIVLRAHNIEHLIWERHVEGEKNLLKKKYLTIQIERLKKSELAVFQKVDYIIPITPVDEKWIEKSIDKRKLKTILTGVLLSDYSIEKSSDFNTNSIFCFGSMDWLPNQQAVNWFLENCWDKILEKKPDCTFVIAGRNIPDTYKNLQNTNIEVIENVPDPREIYSKYNIMLVPLQSGSGLRIKLVEGLSYGKVIVTTSIGSEGIDNPTNNAFVIADSIEEFTREIVNLLENEAYRKELEKNARKFAEANFDNHQIVKELVSFYETIV